MFSAALWKISEFLSENFQFFYGDFFFFFFFFQKLNRRVFVTWPWTGGLTCLLSDIFRKSKFKLVDFCAGHPILSKYPIRYDLQPFSYLSVMA